ncbi:MAG: 3-hydroxyacyl-CoA dehydrogenase family protein, partial [Solirubrobacteraceae bacterium]
KEFIANNPSVVMPWDDKKYRIPGGALIPNNVPFMLGVAGNSIKNTHNKMPNVRNYLAVVAHGMQLPIDRAIEVEARFFANTLQSKEAKAMMRSIFINRQNAVKGKYKPAGLENSAKVEFKKVGVLGAGMMGAGIAYASVTSGIEVVLKDVSIEAAEKGKDYTKNLLAVRVSKGKMTQEKMDETLSKIKTTADYADLKDCDLIIEAVFENIQLKSEVTKLTEAQISTSTVFASNTSSIPITKLAEASVRDDKFIGIHFFSPVDKMMLVEVIPGEKTSKETIAAAIDYVAKIKKIPIVVKDSYSFYVNRVFAVLFEELGKLVDEGVSFVLIENLWKNMGMPVGAFALADELYLPLIQKLGQTAIDLGFIDKNNLPAWNVIINKLIELGRLGKKDGKGFYDYSSSPKRMWTGLKDLFPEKDHGMSNETIQKRIFHRAAVETARCLEEGIVGTPDECDLGSLFGMGFLPYTGGAAGYMDYIGLEKFISECDELTTKYGNGFKIPDTLRSKKSIY